MVSVKDIEMLLKQRGLLSGTAGEGSGDQPDEDVRWLTCDSRAVTEGTVFICKGAAFREEYLKEAERRGCVAYISEKSYETCRGITGFIVCDIRRAMAAVSSLFFGYEPGRPVLTGITGTKGKTTTAWYLKAMLDTWREELGQPETGLISTVANYDGIHRTDANMTTPEAPVLHEILANAKSSGTSYVTMEVSSQALKYKRVQELIFQVGIFLNISEDHISPQEHEDFEDYFSAKLSMFRQTETACVNLDSDHADRIMKAANKAGRIVTFGRHPLAQVRCCEVRTEHGMITFRVVCDRFAAKFSLGMKGKFNIENAMAAIAAGYVLHIPVHCMQKALASAHVPGRMETFFSTDGRICGIVDFAHNRLSFEKLYDAVFQEFSSYTNIITVFGCPGDKAFNRRKELGILAGLFSDYVWVTSDDPGLEGQEAIAAEIRRYVEGVGCACRCVKERREAVREAVAMAAGKKEKTLILILGRGSEKYQRIGRSLHRYPTDANLLEAALGEYRGLKVMRA